eukprot:TRINITY_DN20734_c0_g1_i1.p1 TRINITY_DN20734_c0_g1~~TRINITY_DN20734_c0_g1_i1.p1  ORF type:complete len:251 (-),score=35.49 TRINITY_DN20734_c0_g1_i1:38-790(-)
MEQYSLIDNLVLFLRSSLPSLVTYITAYWVLDKGQLLEVLFPFLKGCPSNIRVDWISRILSSYNAIYMVCGVIVLLIRDDGLHEDLIYYTSPEAFHYSSNFFGYIVYDLALSLSYSCLWDPSIIFHHILFLTLVALSNTFQLFSGVGCWVTLNEISTFFLNLIWFFITTQSTTKKKLPTQIVRATQILFVVTFFLFRVLVNTVITKKVITNIYPTSNPLKPMVYVLFPVVCILNWYWFAQIMTRAQRYRV